MSEERPSYVYVIRAGDFVKIGKADNPDGRINGFRTGNPHRIETITTIEVEGAKDAYSTERCLHQQFSEAGLRHDREWFKWTAGLEATVLGLGSYFHFRDITDRYCQSQFDEFSRQYITKSMTCPVAMTDRTIHVTDYPGSRLRSYRLGMTIDCSFRYDDTSCPMNLAPMFSGPYFDNGDIYLSGFVNELDNEIEIHSSIGFYSVIPKVAQARISELLSTSEAE